MKQSPQSNLSVIFNFLPALIVILLLNSCSNGTDSIEKAVDTSKKVAAIVQPLTQSKNIFLNMATSVADLKRVSRPGQNFRRIILQFNNDGYNNAQDAFIYSVAAYALKNNDYFDSTFLKPSGGSVQLATPFRLANLEWRTQAIDRYIRALRDGGTPIENFDSVRFKPFVDTDYGRPILNLEITPFRTGTFDSAALAVSSTKLNPCPPARQQ